MQKTSKLRLGLWVYGILDLSKVILCRIHHHFKELLITVVLGHRGLAQIMQISSGTLLQIHRDCQHDVAAQGPVPNFPPKKTPGGTSSRRRLMDLRDFYFQDSPMGLK